MRFPALSALAVLFLLTGCLTTRTTATGIPCQALEPITYSASKDTPETVRQVREFNAVLRELCR